MMSLKDELGYRSLRDLMVRAVVHLVERDLYFKLDAALWVAILRAHIKLAPDKETTLEWMRRSLKWSP